MNISVNGVPTYYDVQITEDLNKHWMNITKEIIENGEVIQSIEIDGVEYQGDHSQLLMSQFDQIDSVKIITMSMENSFYLTLQDLNQYATKVLEMMSDYITPLYSGTIQECRELSTVVESLEWIITTTNYLQHLVNTSKLTTDINHVINETVDKYNILLEMLTSELEWGNLIGFADIVQYEFIPTLEIFHSASKEVGFPERDALQ
ncbi:hypothetical protein [Paenibacillus aquistagni]|uniref:hypothetical protein n=1 Tax=Paenibacillus aquistagni TaxID=1852522 RepID=UPI000B5131BC|nr:hypothetical protein [Paenibacillus aquistagni]